jgi:hypothetical protein
VCRQVSLSFADGFFVLGVLSIIELHVSGMVSCGSGSIVLDMSVLDQEKQAFKLSGLDSFIWTDFQKCVGGEIIYYLYFDYQY